MRKDTQERDVQITIRGSRISADETNRGIPVPRAHVMLSFSCDRVSQRVRRRVALRDWTFSLKSLSSTPGSVRPK